ncbi:MAG: methyltransferase domain-containing protein [Theionarchaea archaeon]|nr:methyltransferase domain-containing protein [Theionarchaea archaeon]
MRKEEIRIYNEFFAKLGKKDVIILDAATGSGRTTLEIAKRITGKVLSVDIDVSRDAHDMIRDAGYASRVEFVEANLGKMDFLHDNAVDAIVSHATLSSIPSETPCMLYDVFKEFYRILKPQGFILIFDYYPLEEAATRGKADKIAEEAWRTYKAVAELLGDYHHEELPPEWVCKTLAEVGFQDVTYEKVSERRLSETFGEYVENMLEYVKEIEDKGLRNAFEKKVQQLAKDAKKYGKSDYSDTYGVWGRK